MTLSGDSGRTGPPGIFTFSTLTFARVGSAGSAATCTSAFCHDPPGARLSTSRPPIFLLVLLLHVLPMAVSLSIVVPRRLLIETSTLAYYAC